MKSATVVRTVISFCLFAVATSLQAQAADLRPDWKPGVAGEPSDIMSPVHYMDDSREFFAGGLRQIAGQMIVLANEKGAAAVRLTAGESKPGIAVAKYEFRYESFDGKTQKTGKGELYEQPNEAGVMGGNVHITIIDLSIGWSYADDHCGWIYYNPEKLRVHLTAASLYSSRSEPTPFQPGELSTTPALDLKRFKPCTPAAPLASLRTEQPQKATEVEKVLKERLALLQTVAKWHHQAYQNGRVSLSEVLASDRAALEAEMEFVTTPVQRLIVREASWKTAESLVKAVERFVASGEATHIDLDVARAHLLHAKADLLNEH